ncbi:hypothetical protein SLA2020_484760 [Shorea laevis]
MLSQNACSLSSSHFLQWRRIKRSKALEPTVKPAGRTLNGGQSWKVRTECFQGLRKIDWIANKNNKSLKEKYVRFGLEKEYALESEEGDSDSTGFHINFLWKQLKTCYTFARPFSQIGMIIQVISASLLPVQTIGDLSPTLFVGILKALVPSLLMSIYIAGVNQIYDVEIDKINKPYLPLASGDLSMETGIAITAAAVTMSLVMAFMLSPSLFLALFVIFLAGSAYSIDLPLLRWKKYPFLEAISMMIMFISVSLGYFTHIQKYVLGKPIVATKSLVFAAVASSFFAVLTSLFKDIPDVEGDKALGVQSMSVKIGKENVFWLCVKMLLMAYGAAVVVGATSSSLWSRLITITGHCLLANFVVFQTQSIDLTSKTSIDSFYMFIWKLIYAEFFLIPFVR